MQAEARLVRALDRVTHAQQELEQSTLGLFLEFESRYTSIATALVEWVGDSRRASRWMLIQRGAFNGKCGFELAIEGDVDTLWEHISIASISKSRAYQAY